MFFYIPITNEEYVSQFRLRDSAKSMKAKLWYVGFCWRICCRKWMSRNYFVCIMAYREVEVIDPMLRSDKEGIKLRVICYYEIRLPNIYHIPFK